MVSVFSRVMASLVGGRAVETAAVDYYPRSGLFARDRRGLERAALRPAFRRLAC